MSKIDILDKPIARIQETCAMMGIADQFDRALPELETFLEGEIANGETSETRLTYDGLCHLREILRSGRQPETPVKPRGRRSRRPGRTQAR